MPKKRKNVATVPQSHGEYSDVEEGMDYNEGKGLRQMGLGGVLRRVFDSTMCAVQWAGCIAAAIARRLFIPFIFIVKLILYVPTYLFGPRASQFELYQLRKEVESLRKEKEDALNRLSQMVSVKLRDNNPNIVDLNDPYRPTKLAEMFSELYDNEWTDAFTVMEGNFSETEIITFLLDIVMESYDFCKGELGSIWHVVSDWFLDENLPDNQELQHKLKERQKGKVLKHLENIDTKFMEKMIDKEKNERLKQQFLHGDIKEYIKSCIKLSLLANSSDPPVVMSCISQPAKSSDSKPDECIIDIPEHDNNCSKQFPNLKDSSEIIEMQEMGSKSAVNKFGEKVDVIKTSDTVHENKTGAPEYNVDTKDKKPSCPANNFETGIFKEYTRKGKFIQYVVWPALYLHEAGPLLAKGVAQGTDDLLA